MDAGTGIGRMNANTRCPRCGTTLPAGTPEWLCPQCLLQQARQEAAPEEEARPGGPRATESAPQPGYPSLPIRLGDYELLEVLGRGGMGVVYKARQVSLDRCVALKVLSPTALGNPETVHRFRTEAVTAASLQHPNIVAVHEVGHAEGLHYLVMDYVPGPTLAEVSRSGPLAGRRAARYLRTVAEAVHFAHERGILHRDLKPSNILVDEDDRPRVTDFGLAKRLEGGSEFTLSGQVLGSPAFIPPEQASGQRGRVGRRSDVYALGAILYQLLSGRPPFVGEGLAETLERVLHAEPLRPRLLNPAIPQDLETVCLKCLEKEPDRRYPTAQALAEELGRWLEGRPILARPLGALGRTARWCRRKPLIATLAAGLVLSIVAGFGGVLTQLHRARSAELDVRRRAYAADMGLVQQALEAGDLGRARRLLDQHRPGKPSTTPGGSAASRSDFRGWEWRYLWARSRSDLNAILARYRDEVSVLAFSEDGRQLTVGLGDGSGALWDVSTRRPTWEWPRGERQPLASSRSGRFLARVERTGSNVLVTVSETATRRELRRWAQSHEVLSMAFSPAEDELATLTHDGALRVGNLKTGQNASIVFASGKDRAPGRYTVTTNAWQFEPMGSNASKEYGRVLYSPDARYLVLGEAKPWIRLFDRVTTNEILLPLPSPADGVTALAVSPDGRWLSAGGGWADRRVHLWDLQSLTERNFHGHHGWITGLAFSPDSQALASVGTDRTLRIWSVPGGDELRSFQGSLDRLVSVAWAPDRPILVTGGEEGTLRAWDTAAKAPLPFQIPPPFCYWGNTFARDSRSLLTVLRSDGSVRRWGIRWDSTAIEELERLDFVGTGHSCLDISPDGRWLALGDWAGSVRIYDLPTGCLVTNRTIPQARVFVLFFSPGGSYLNVGALSQDDRCLAQFWDTTGWREILALNLSTWEFTGYGFSPDDRTVGLGFRNGTAVWHDLRSGRRRSFGGTKERLVALAFSPDGRWFAASGVNAAITLWDIPSGHARPIPGTEGTVVRALAFSPDSRRLAASGARLNGAIRLWDVDSGSEVATLTGPPERDYLPIGFSPDGNTLFVSTPWGPSVFWCAPSWEDIEQAEKTAAGEVESENP